MNGAPHNFQLLEPPSPDRLIPNPWVEPWMIVTAVLLLIALLVFIFFARRARVAAVDPLALRRAAHAEAAAMLGAITPATARSAAVQCSLIVRKYLSVAAGDPALFETHEEYVSRHESLANFTEEARTAAGQAFSRLASLKYAREVSSETPAEVITASRALLETLHQGLKA